MDKIIVISKIVAVSEIKGYANYKSCVHLEGGHSLNSERTVEQWAESLGAYYNELPDPIIWGRPQ